MMVPAGCQRARDYWDGRDGASARGGRRRGRSAQCRRRGFSPRSQISSARFFTQKRVLLSAFSSAVISFFLVLVLVVFSPPPLVLKGRSFIGKQY